MIDHDHYHVRDGHCDDGGPVGEDGADDLCDVKLLQMAYWPGDHCDHISGGSAGDCGDGDENDGGKSLMVMVMME